MENTFPTSPVVAAGLLGAYGLARATGVRPLGGAVLAACGILAGREWAKRGIPETVGLSMIYVAAFGLSHPLAKKVGAWPAVLTATAAAAGAAYAMHDHPTPVAFPGSRPD